MSLKKPLIITAIWTVLTLGGGALGVWYVVSHPIRGVRAEDRAAKLGTGIGTLTVIGYAGIWLPYAAKVGKQKRIAREEAAKNKRKQRSRKRKP